MRFYPVQYSFNVVDFFIRITPFWMLAQAMTMPCGGFRSVAKGPQFAD
jgi:hypothetical protein